MCALYLFLCVPFIYSFHIIFCYNVMFVVKHKPSVFTELKIATDRWDNVFLFVYLVAGVIRRVRDNIQSPSESCGQQTRAGRR